MAVGSAPLTSVLAFNYQFEKSSPALCKPNYQSSIINDHHPLSQDHLSLHGWVYRQAIEWYVLPSIHPSCLLWWIIPILYLYFWYLLCQGPSGSYDLNGLLIYHFQSISCSRLMRNTSLTIVRRFFTKPVTRLKFKATFRIRLAVDFSSVVGTPRDQDD